MARLIDTSVFIAMERGDIPLSVLAAELNGQPVGIASITASELLVGYYRSMAASLVQQRRRLGFIEKVISEFPVIAFDLEVARMHARISVELATSGRSIGTHDLLIASTALERGLELLTYNTRQFERVPGLRVTVPSWQL